MIQTRTNNQAHALILSMAVLMLLSIMAIQFSGMASLEMQASYNFQESQGARLVAQAGIEFAIANIRTGFQDPLYHLWRYRSADIDAHVDPQYYANRFAEDEIGAGVSLTAIQTVVPGINTNYPSFATDATKVNIGGSERMVSGWVNGNRNQVYTLKVFDVASQININSFQDGSKLATVLNNLSWAIAQRQPYKSSSGFDSAGPLHGLGTQIFNSRPANGYQNKSQLVGISGDGKSISESDLQFVYDYLTVYPRPAEMQANSTFQRIRFTSPGNEKSYQQDLRSPVNINTASWPVLVAVFKDIGTASIAISGDEAIVLANCVCISRLAGMYFPDLANFFTFIENQRSSIFSSDAEAKVSIIKANANASTFPRRLNPDKIIYQTITKADLTHHSTEFCYSPLGFFEIGILGECFDPHGVRTSVCEQSAVVKIFDLYIQATQKDFEQGSRYSDLSDRITNKQGFSQGNNLLKSSVGADDASKYFGMIQPVCYNSTTGSSILDDRKDISEGGSQPLGQGGNYTFKADFNGVPDANKGGQMTAYGTKVTGGQAVPNDSSGTFSDFAADGVVFHEGETDTLYYLSRPHEAVETMIQAAAADPSNMPPTIDSSGLSANNNEGTLMFWFKINSDWKANEWRTVCFSNTAYNADNGSDSYQMGIQKEIQMKITEPDASQPFLRKAEIKVRSKYYCLDLSDPNKPAIKPPEALMPFGLDKDVVDSTQTVILDPANNSGIQAQQWYHLAVRWKKGNTFNGFADDSDMNVCIRGNFYNSSNQQQPGSYRKDNVSYPGCDGGSTADEYITVKDNPPETTFQPIIASLSGYNRLYLGYAGYGNSPAMTIDDFRITADTSAIAAADYTPSRFSLPNDQSIYGEFKGSSPGTSSTQTLFAKTVTLNPSSQAASDTPISGGGGETPSTEWIQISGLLGLKYGLYQSSWQSIWNEISNANEHTITAADLGAKVKKIDIDIIAQGGGGFRRHVKIQFDNDTEIVNSNVAVFATDERSYEHTFRFIKPTLAEVLVTWYLFRHGKLPQGLNNSSYTPTPPDTPVVDVTPPVVDPLPPPVGSVKNYDLKFKAGADVTGIFESATVVEVISARTCKLMFPQFLEQR